ncbi:hypothetical protein NOCA180020 [metagenome]|uniref:ANTAR domain-containing protein n=1 Tax=metagenome TaxID=256318 RepID=A0A2P2CKB0_9ZZZZ
MSGTPLSPGGPSGPVDQPDPELRAEIAQLQEAVQSQRAIGMAIGLLSARYECSTEQAWRSLLRISQDSNTKVRTVARVLVATHDGSSDGADQALLDAFVAHLPASRWPPRRVTGEDLAP